MAFGPDLAHDMSVWPMDLLVEQGIWGCGPENGVLFGTCFSSSRVSDGCINSWCSLSCHNTAYPTARSGSGSGSWKDPWSGSSLEGPGELDTFGLDLKVPSCPMNLWLKRGNVCFWEANEDDSVVNKPVYHESLHKWFGLWMKNWWQQLQPRTCH